jgi:hypothetical protein
MSEYKATHKHQTHNHAASGWRIHCGVEVTELSTNKQHTLSLLQCLAFIRNQHASIRVHSIRKKRGSKRGSETPNSLASDEDLQKFLDRPLAVLETQTPRASRYVQRRREVHEKTNMLRVEMSLY